MTAPGPVRVRPTALSSAVVLDQLLALALQPSWSGFEEGLKGLWDSFGLAAWACLFPPSFNAGGRHLFIAHAIRTPTPMLQRAAREGWENFMADPTRAPQRLQELATELAPGPDFKGRVIQLNRGRQTGFTLFAYRTPDFDFTPPELELLAQVGRQVDRCFVAMARQQEQEFVGGLFKAVCDFHPDGLCVLDQRWRALLENKLFRNHMLVWEHGPDAASQINLPRQTQLPEVWREACQEAFAAYEKTSFSPTPRLMVSQGPLVFLDKRVSPYESLEGSVRYVAFQNSLGVIPYLMLTCSMKRTVARRLPTLERLAEQHRFSPREIDVARLVLEGATAAEIAERLKVAVPTVKSHIRNILQKSSVKTRLQFVSLCHR